VTEQIIDCGPLKAKVSPLQCLTNRIKALVLWTYPNASPGLLQPCLTCPVGKRVRAYLPNEGEV
jgi:hypothetical protein